MVSNILIKLLNFRHFLCIKLTPRLNRWFFRHKGVIYGSNMNILGRVSLIGRGKITIGDNFCMTSGEHVNPISANLQGSFYTDCQEATIKIGNNVGMSSTRMWIHDSLTIGNNVKVGACVLLIDTDCHEIDFRVRRGEVPQGSTPDQSVQSAPIVIEDDVWIGAHSIVLKGVTIGARSIIGAGSVVTKSIPADCIAAGNPCKVIRTMNY